MSYILFIVFPIFLFHEVITYLSRHPCFTYYYAFLWLVICPQFVEPKRKDRDILWEHYYIDIRWYILFERFSRAAPRAVCFSFSYILLFLILLFIHISMLLYHAFSLPHIVFPMLYIFFSNIFFLSCWASFAENWHIIIFLPIYTCLLLYYFSWSFCCYIMPCPPSMFFITYLILYFPVLPSRLPKASFMPLPILFSLLYSCFSWAEDAVMSKACSSLHWGMEEFFLLIFCCPLLLCFFLPSVDRREESFRD